MVKVIVVKIFYSWKQVNRIYTVSAVTDTTILDCRDHYGYYRKVIFPVTMFWMEPMNQIVYQLK